MSFKSDVETYNDLGKLAGSINTLFPLGSTPLTLATLLTSDNSVSFMLFTFDGRLNHCLFLLYDMTIFTAKNDLRIH